MGMDCAVNFHILITKDCQAKGINSIWYSPSSIPDFLEIKGITVQAVGQDAGLTERVVHTVCSHASQVQIKQDDNDLVQGCLGTQNVQPLKASAVHMSN